MLAEHHMLPKARVRPDLDEPEPPQEIVIVLDPGKKAAGFTVWFDEKLVGAWLARGSDAIETARDGLRVIKPIIDDLDVTITFVTEFPQVYPGIRKEDPNDLLPLAECVGAVTALLPHNQKHVVLPRTWTKGTPKDVRLMRAKETASVDELRIMGMSGAPKSLEHNVWDSYALGKWFLQTRKN
jgi:hypothetical protein